MRSIALILVLCVLPAYAQASNTLEGLWLTENKRSVIEIVEADNGPEGYVYWITRGGMTIDLKNPDENKRGKPMCGLPILWGFEKESDMAWSDGQIYKADDGDIYNANMELRADGTLKVRGYVGISLFGKSQIWNSVSASDYERCSLPND